MRVRFDCDTCIGMYRCVAEWNAFEKDTDDGKAGLAESEAVEPDLFERAVPADIELDATFAARVCPVDAIEGYDDGEQLVRPDGTTTASLIRFTAQPKTPTARLNTHMNP
ncbi:ferredoxin [Halobacteriales archaeon QS_9_68_42]|nr:MAG: ferredoxin [Halobacteriales archaeon QS_9_68_42]